MEKPLLRNDILIRRKFNSYLIPGVVMVVAMQLGNIVDCIFVSRWIDLDGLTAISLSMPVLLVMQVIGMTFGGGCAAMISNLLGKRELEKASELFSASILAVLGLSLIFTVLAPFTAGPISRFLTPSPVLAELLEQYLFLFMLLIPILNLCILFSNVVSVDNNPKLGAHCFIIANVVNLLTEYIFLNYTSLGMRGAALSTIIGYAAGLIMVVPYIRSPRRMLQPSLGKARNGARELVRVLRAGAPQASLFGMRILQFFILNTMIQSALGPDYLSIYAVCLNAVTIVRLFIDGVVGLIQTVAGVLYGEKDYYGIRALVKRTVITTAGLVVMLTAFFLAFPQALLTLFSFNKQDIYDVALSCVRLYSLSFAFFAANRLAQVYYQATLFTFLSTMDTMLQGFIWLVPVVALLMRFMGIQGVCLAVAVAEALTFITVWVYRSIRQRQGKLPQKGFLMIPDREGSVLCDVSISSTEGDAIRVSEQLIACCLENGVPKRQANAVGVAAEELAVNIARYGYRRDNPCAIDICLSMTDQSLILRLRDDGVPFNPTEYQREEAETFAVGGIELIRRVAGKMSYARVLNMNNTIIEVYTA